MAHGDPVASPLVQEYPDYQHNLIRITVTFDNASRAITGITVFRDAACVYHRILIGIGADGDPASTTRSVNVPTGTTVLSAGQLTTLRNNGVGTIEEFLSFQLTAGP